MKLQRDYGIFYASTSFYNQPFNKEELPRLLEG